MSITRTLCILYEAINAAALLWCVLLSSFCLQLLYRFVFRLPSCINKEKHVPHHVTNHYERCDIMPAKSCCILQCRLQDGPPWNFGVEVKSSYEAMNHSWTQPDWAKRSFGPLCWETRGKHHKLVLRQKHEHVCITLWTWYRGLQKMCDYVLATACH